MQIVLPGSLPDPREARELTPHMLKAAPTLGGWLQLGLASATAASPAVAGCTPYERWQLAARGFKPGRGQNLSAGLGPLWGDKVTKRDQPVWLAELVHVSPSREGARLLAARDLSITTADSVALFDSAQELFAGSTFTAHPLDTEHWRIEIHGEFAPVCASPSLVALSSVNDWWPQDREARPWRKLVNELQMQWFEHPVNQARETRGLAPINSLWLFGGARPDQLADPIPGKQPQVHDALLASFHAHDWGRWLQALERLEATLFKPLLRKQPELVLIGNDKYVEIRPSSWLGFLKRLPGTRDSWRTWWSPLD
ncbi:hypothetical protein LSG25_01335 [Paralcaligenes sp. KSB-10]|uniref:hypothetical protein n=1 Tax=Paralcaligenes sp. KSB-10 TaxID=2901142 RepID=UPI001E3260D4|nr:hypothetical protein [Paralcaligenes sp. KSB-10]UHL64582.1 hypothetical protein LSG25_01335 [Paralcaligenes sp. KSB-10]